MAGRHGAVIYNEHCGFPNRYRVFGHAASADVDYADLSGPPPNRSGGLADQESIRRFVTKASEAIASSEDSRIRVTVIGLVRAAEHYATVPVGDDDFMGNGYGLMGHYPIQILILGVKEYAIKAP